MKQIFKSSSNKKEKPENRSTLLTFQERESQIHFYEYSRKQTLQNHSKISFYRQMEVFQTSFRYLCITFQTHFFLKTIDLRNEIFQFLTVVVQKHLIKKYKLLSTYSYLIKFMEGQQLAPKPGHFLFTSENVTSGHPDKLCDYISDSVLDACLQKDPNAKVACQSAVKNSICMVFGQISTNGDVNFEQVARQAIKEVGYDSNDIGMDYKTATVIIAIDKQSPQIAQSVHQNKKDQQIGAGDQGLMIGYASDQTKNFMPLSHDLSSALVRRLEQCRKQKILNWLRPDGKVQVTVQYERKGNLIEPKRVHTVLISTQHNPDISNEKLREDIFNEVIKVAIPANLLVNTRYIINPSEKFVIGGPHGDAGLTGRKIIADTYGGWGGHGGGAFSGKDPTKVDRSAAYAARWIAKNLVANGFCRRAMVQVAYSIGIAQPLSIHVDSYNTVIEGFSDEDLQGIVYRNFDLRPGMIIKNFDLRRPIYRKTASGGHFGRNEPEFKWESVIDLSHQKKK